MSQMNTQQQSCFSLMDLSPVPQYSLPNSCYPQARVNNFLINDRPSTLNQLPSQNNIGSAILDRTEDPKANLYTQFNQNKSLTFSTYNNPFQNNDIHNNLYYNNNPETNDFLNNHEQEMNHLNHRLDSVNILEKKDTTIHNLVQQPESFYTEEAKQGLISTPPNNPSENLFGNVQIFENNGYPQTLTPQQKTNTSQHSLQSNIPTPNIGQVISSIQVSEKIPQSSMVDHPFLFPTNCFSNNYPIPAYQNIDIQSQTTGQANGQYLNIEKQNNYQNPLTINTNTVPHQIGKQNQYEKIKEQMKKLQDQQQQNGLNQKGINTSNISNTSNSYSYQLNMQQSTNSMNSQTSISSSSSIQDHSQANQTNCMNNYPKLSYPLSQYSSTNQNANNNYNSIQASNNSGAPSAHISSSQSVGGIYTANKLNIPLSMTSSVNNVIVEEQERDNAKELRDRNYPYSKESDSDEELGENSNKQGNLDMQEYARKVDFCKCKKSKCLKLYCECFLRGNYCNEQCICTDCGNNDKNCDERDKAIDEAKTRNSDAFNLKFEVSGNSRVTHKKGCHCKRTHCLKKYCECYNAGLKCTNNCKCEDCKNTVDNLKNLGGGNGASGVNAIQKMEEDANSSEINSQMIQSIDYQFQHGPIERKISMCSSTGISNLSNRKRTRSEVLDQIQPKVPDTQQPLGNEPFEPEIRKKKNSLCVKQSSIPNTAATITQSKMKTSYQPNQTSYNSFDANFIFTSTHSQKQNNIVTQPTNPIGSNKKIQS